MKNRKNFIIILILFIILLLVIIGKNYYLNVKQKNNEEIIEVKGFVSSKKQDDSICILEENKGNINSLKIKNNGFEINDALILKLKTNNIEVVECKKTYDESWILDELEDTIIKIGQYNLNKKINNDFTITDSKNRTTIDSYIIPIKKDGKYIKTFSPDIFINYANKFYDSEQNFIFKEKDENIILNMKMPTDSQLLSFNMINEINDLSFDVENENIRFEIKESGTYYAIFEENNDNYYELIFDIILVDN